MKRSTASYPWLGPHERGGSVSAPLGGVQVLARPEEAARVSDQLFGGDRVVPRPLQKLIGPRAMFRHDVVEPSPARVLGGEDHDVVARMVDRPEDELAVPVGMATVELEDELGRVRV